MQNTNFNQHSHLMQSEAKHMARGRGAGKIWIAVLILLLLGALGAAGYFYKKYSDIKANPAKAAQDETATLIAKVGNLIELPNENPTIATVTDPNALKNQPFFANAKAGDKVLIYSTAKKAILYDPVENKIVEVAPVNLGSDSTSSPDIRSGTKTSQ